jgi:hypothetical protein
MTNESSSQAEAEVLARLKEGEARFQTLVERSAAAGTPLPAGGIFLLTPLSVWIACCNELVHNIAHWLKLPPKLVELKMTAPETVPVVEVGVPKGYAGDAKRDDVTKHIEGTIDICLEEFEKRWRSRLAALGWECPAPKRSLIVAP